MVQAHYILMGGFVIEVGSDDSSSIKLLQWQHLRRLVEVEGPDWIQKQLPSDQDINDRSKTDALTTVLACLQSLWLVVQCIGRGLEDLGKITSLSCGIAHSGV